MPRRRATTLRYATRSGIPADLAIRAEFPRTGRDLGTVEYRQHRRVGEIGANIRDHLGRPQRTSGVHAISEKNHEHLTLGVDPHRGAGEASMSVGGLAEIAAGTIVAFSRVPAECAVSERSGSKELHGRLAQDLHAVVLAAVEHHLGEDRKVGGRAE